MKRFIGGVVLVTTLMVFLVYSILTGFQPPNPSWQNPALGISGVALLILAVVLIAKGLEGIAPKREDE